MSRTGNRKRVLITGPSGSGKTSLSARIRERGLNGVDADSVPGLCGWFDESGLPATFPECAEKEFLDHHRFLWQRESLLNFLESSEDVFFCGISRNAFEMIDLFDTVFFLKVSSEVLVSRLQSPTRTNPMGTSPFQREYILFWAAKFEAIARELRVSFIDASRPLDEIVEVVCASARQHSARP